MIQADEARRLTKQGETISEEEQRGIELRIQDEAKRGRRSLLVGTPSGKTRGWLAGMSRLLEAAGYRVKIMEGDQRDPEPLLEVTW